MNRLWQPVGVIAVPYTMSLPLKPCEWAVTAVSMTMTACRSGQLDLNQVFAIGFKLFAAWIPWASRQRDQLARAGTPIMRNPRRGRSAQDFQSRLSRR